MQNLKCLLIQLLLEVLCLCQSQFAADQEAPTGGQTSSGTLIADKLQIDYAQFTFAGGQLSKHGFQFEQELVQFVHSVLVEEPLVIEQLHRQTYPLEVVSLVVREVKSVQFALNFLPAFVRADFD